MDTFTAGCLIILLTAIVWHIFALFIFDGSRYQRYRLKEALSRITDYSSACSGKSAKSELKLIHRNKRFTVSVTKKDFTAHYSVYSIFINGSEAGKYHQLRHRLLSTYFFEEINDRYELEVASIVMAAGKKLREIDKTNKENESSYFK